MKIDKESLDNAIAEFNEWNGPARIYINKNDGKFDTSVYLNDVSMSETYSVDNYIAVYSKQEIETKKIGAKRRNFIERYAELIMDDMDTSQAKYKLFEEGLYRN